MSKSHETLSRRERQIMDLVWTQGQASAQEIHDGLADDAPSYSAVRALLAILVNKGHLKFDRNGRRYVYRPTMAPAMAGKSALKRLLATFFDNSAVNLVATLLDPAEKSVTPAEQARIRELIAAAKSSPRK